jgi:hypothetical protein
MDFMRQALETGHKNEVRLAGGFRTNGGSNPTVLFGDNWIQSVVRDGAGAYTVTLKKAYRGMDLIGKNTSLQLAAAGDSKTQFGAYDKAAGTQVIRTITGAAAADIASDANNIVWLELICRYGNVPDGSTTYDT